MKHISITNANENRRGRLTLSMRVSKGVPKLVIGVGLEGWDRFYRQEREEWTGISGRGRVSDETKPWKDAYWLSMFHQEWGWSQKDGVGVILQWHLLFEFELYCISSGEPSDVSVQDVNMINCSIKTSSDPSMKDLSAEEREAGKRFFQSKVQRRGWS